MPARVFVLPSLPHTQTLTARYARAYAPHLRNPLALLLAVNLLLYVLQYCGAVLVGK